jgi:hypothetical protein
VKRIILLATAALVAMLILVPMAVAQTPPPEPLPPSGGLANPSVLLPAAALLLGSGVLGYAILRRR